MASENELLAITPWGQRKPIYWSHEHPVHTGSEHKPRDAELFELQQGTHEVGRRKCGYCGKVFKHTSSLQLHFMTFPQHKDHGDKLPKLSSKVAREASDESARHDTMDRAFDITWPSSEGLPGHAPFKARCTSYRPHFCIAMSCSECKRVSRPQGPWVRGVRGISTCAAKA
mmetsp:Transcript_105032/g.172636  ORF Transcript_105032/g.172636 Transcript_105032/m.172636 type:complete len:171 (-) Transcript_105032:1-513(-)